MKGAGTSPLSRESELSRNGEGGGCPSRTETPARPGAPTKARRGSEGNDILETQDARMI
jgi:hypothetical protein